MNPYPLAPTLGTIPDDKIPGRVNEITNLLRLLRSQSVSVEEMRRMGKTLMLKKMAYLCNADQLPAEFANEKFRAKYLSFQGIKDMGEVIKVIIDELESFKAWYKIDFGKTYNLVRSVINAPDLKVAGTSLSFNLPEYKKSWKEIFYKTLEDIADSQNDDGTILVLIFDELPIMLWDWYKNGKQQEAIELLDILRERRQKLETKGIRFVYCGSIGIKVVLDRFKTEFQYTGEPTNEMAEFDLKPFKKDESDFLCECFLMNNFKIEDERKAESLERIYQLSNGLPFQISKLFNILQTEFDYQVDIRNIEESYNIILNNSDYHKAFMQLIDRLDIYYPKDKSEVMKKLLNEISKSDVGLSEEEIHQRTDIDELTSAKEGLYTLFADHYLSRTTQDGNRVYKFKYQIFKEWWKINIA
ncbi:MAG: hypothetical protein EOO20_07515 [Chryseobacterium sp.]|nr:MAG: hypothetical protein EOO20_07515 [Chryseobacterium sp.]